MKLSDLEKVRNLQAHLCTLTMLTKQTVQQGLSLSQWELDPRFMKRLNQAAQDTIKDIHQELKSMGVTL